MVQNARVDWDYEQDSERTIYCATILTNLYQAWDEDFTSVIPEGRDSCPGSRRQVVKSYIGVLLI